MNLTSTEIAGETELVPGMSPRTFAKGSTEVTTRLQEQTFSTSIASCKLPNPCVVTYFDGSREDYLNFVVPLYEASIMGDWETAKLVLAKRPELIRLGVSKQLGTALHVVATAKESNATLHFVKNLVNMMTREELELGNQFLTTAFWIASANGNLGIAKIMLEKDPSLLSIRCDTGLLPLSISAQSGKYNTVKYLYHNSHNMIGDQWGRGDKKFLLLQCLEREFFGK